MKQEAVRPVMEEPCATPVYQKIVLFVFSVFLTAVILEGGLRLGGLLFSLRQDAGNQAAFSKEEVRVLCIGESTTALGGENSYPAQLQKILNQRRPDIDFKVINKGLVSKTSTDIVHRLPDYLRQYHPDIVVAMIGINDHNPEFNQAQPARNPVKAFLSQTRIYHLFSLLSLHLKVKWGRNSLSGTGPEGAAPATDLREGDPMKGVQSSQVSAQKIRELQTLRALLGAQLKQPVSEAKREEIVLRLDQLRTLESYLHIHLGWYYRMQKEYPAAEQQLEQAILLDPESYGGLVELARCYSEQGQCDKALPLLKQAMILSQENVLGGMELARCLDNLGMVDGAKAVYLQVFAKDSSLFRVDGTIGRWMTDHNFFAEAERVLLDAARKHPTDFYLYEDLSRLYEKMGQTEKAREAAGRAEALRGTAEHVSALTAANYNTIARMVLGEGLRLIWMQYPTRQVSPLKAVFSQRDKIFFLENQSNFEQALAGQDYGEYFSDYFAGNFGHCTPKGNRLIAENAAEAILSGYPSAAVQ